MWVFDKKNSSPMSVHQKEVYQVNTFESTALVLIS
jgi:hypothetical protein